MAGYSTEVDWGQLLKDRIKKMSSDNLYDVGLYDAVMDRRARGDQKGNKPVGISTRIGMTGASKASVKNTIGSAAESAMTNKQAINSAPTSGAGASAGAAASSAPTSAAPVAGSGGGTGSSQNTTAPDQAWKWGDPMRNTPFDYSQGKFDAFNGLAAESVDNVSNDPTAQRRYWANYMGGDLTTQMMLGNYIDPETAFLLGGGNGGPAEQLKFSDALMRHATGSSNMGQDLYQSRDIMGSIVGALKAQPVGEARPGEAVKLDPLGMQLGANGDAFSQVQNVINMMDQSVQFTMTERAYAAYKALITREGQAFADYRMSQEGSTANMSFGDWLESRLGPSAGL